MDALEENIPENIYIKDRQSRFIHLSKGFLKRSLRRSADWKETSGLLFRPDLHRNEGPDARD